MKPKLIEGNAVTDDRGVVRFVNDFSFADVKRFYQVSNHEVGFIRAWHGHQKEAKYVYVASGAALIALVNMNKTEEKYRFVLSVDKPSMLYIPPGFYNGSKTLKADTNIMYYATATLEESKDDDFREDWKLYSGEDLFSIKQR